MISTGFPGTVASLRQQWGRAGRRGHGLAVLVASEDALDQYFMREPETLLRRRVEAAILDHANPRVLDGHVLSAAFEAPLDDADREVLGNEALERAAVLPELKSTPAGFVWAGRDYPAARVPLRSTSPDSFSVVDTTTGSVLGLVERERAYSTVHEGAVYLHLGEAYRVAELDLDARQALVSPFSGDLYTQAKKDTMTAIERGQADGAPPRPRAELGRGLRHRAGGRLSGQAGLDPGDPRPRRARSPRDLVRDRGDLVLPGAGDARGARAHAEAARLAARRRARDDRAPAALGDVRPLGHRRPLDQRPLPDRPRRRSSSTTATPAASGITARGFEAFEGWVADTAKMIEGCPCEHGCPSCVQSPKCGNLNDMLDKAGALELLRRMLAPLGRGRRDDQYGARRLRQHLAHGRSETGASVRAALARRCDHDDFRVETPRRAPRSPARLHAL